MPSARLDALAEALPQPPHPGFARDNLVSVTLRHKRGRSTLARL
jgi:hypothetical protein